MQHTNIMQNLRLTFYVNSYDFILIMGRNYDSKKAANESKYYSKFSGTKYGTIEFDTNGIKYDS